MDSFAERIDVYLAAGYAYTKASGVGQLSFNTSVGYEDMKSRNSLAARNTITDTSDDRTSATRVNLDRAVWRKNRADSFRAVFGNYEDNDELDLDYRVGLGAGLGRYFIDTHRSRLFGIAGLQAITEKNRTETGAATNEDVELFLNAGFALWKFTSPELDLDLNLSLYPSITDSGRLRSDTNLRLRWELMDDLFWDITAWASTDNQADKTGRSKDYSITTGIGWEY